MANSAAQSEGASGTSYCGGRQEFPFLHEQLSRNNANVGSADYHLERDDNSDSDYDEQRINRDLGLEMIA